MRELVDKQAVIDALSEKVDEVCVNDKLSADVVLGLMSAMGVVKGLEPDQKKGYWTEEKHPDAMPTLTTTWRCSVCGKDQGYGEPPFCPNCGSRMMQEVEE